MKNYPKPDPRILEAACLASKIAGTIYSNLPGMDKDWYEKYVQKWKELDDATWHNTLKELPPENIPVETRVNDKNGIGNQQILTRKNNRFFADNDLLCYYTPNEWRYIDRENT